MCFNFFIFIQFLKVTFNLQLLHNIGYTVCLIFRFNLKTYANLYFSFISVYGLKEEEGETATEEVQ